MFSFFRRSKGRDAADDGKEKRRSKDRELAKGATPTPSSDRNSAPRGGGGGVAQAPSEFGKRDCSGERDTAAEDDARAAVVDESNDDGMAPMAAFRGKNKRHKGKNGPKSGSAPPTAVSAVQQQQQTTLKSSSIPGDTTAPMAPPRAAHSVKPCSHATVAAVPRTPPQHLQQTGTPPSVRKIDHGDGEDANIATVTAATMKLRVDIPVKNEKFSTPPSTPGTPEPQQAAPTENDADDKRNLVNQETKFQSQVADLTKELSNREEETNKLHFQMEDLQRDVFIKSSGMERLQAELVAAHKESELVRQKLRHLEDDLTTFKQKNADLADELLKKSEEFTELEASSNERAKQLESAVKELTDRIKSLESQLESIRNERDRLEQHKKQLESEREEERKIVQDALDEALQEKTHIQKRWEKDFENLRTINIDREQQLLDDFEWKLREVEQTCKRRLEEKDKKAEDKIKEAEKSIEAKVRLAEQQYNEVKHLKSYEAEVTQLRGLTHDQQRSLRVMSRQTEQLQLAEQNLKEECNRLRGLIEAEKKNVATLQSKHTRDLIDKERSLLIRLEKQKHEVAIQWEERLRQECTRLRNELEQLHAEEKQMAINSIRVQKDQEFSTAKQNWEKRLEQCLKEVEILRNTLKQKEDIHNRDIDKCRTNADRDMMELRRTIDKLDMSYQDKIEKLVEKHEKEMETLNVESEKRIKELETNWQMQASSMRATLELVKEQMERDNEKKMEALKEQHYQQIDLLRNNFEQEKQTALEMLQEQYSLKCNHLKEELHNSEKVHSIKETELLNTIKQLKTEMTSGASLTKELQNKVDCLQDGILNEQTSVQNNSKDVENEQKLLELQESLMSERSQLQTEREEHISEVTRIQKQSQAVIDQLQRKCQCLTKLFEEVRSRYDRRESRQEDLNVISDLRQVIAEQEKELMILNEEKRFFQMELMKKNRGCNQTFENLSVVGVEDRNGWIEPDSKLVTTEVHKSKSLDAPI